MLNPLEPSDYVDVTRQPESTVVIDEQIKRLVSENDVVLFSQSWCPYSTEVKRTLSSYGIFFALFEVDRVYDNKSGPVHKALIRVSGYQDLPNIFVRGESIGGCAQLKALEHSGGLKVLFQPFLGPKTGRGLRVTSMSLLGFPESVNRTESSLAAALTSVHCILCSVFYAKSFIGYIMLGIAIDLVIHTILGASSSFTGLVAALIAPRNTTPKYSPGPPAQVQLLVQSLLAIISTGLYLGDEHLGGLIVSAILAADSAAHAFFHISIGHGVFWLLIRLRWLSIDILRPHLNAVDHRKWADDFYATPYEREQPVKYRVMLPGQTNEMSIDLEVKNRWEIEFKAQDSHPIKHSTVTHFVISMTFAALALVFKSSTSVAGWDTGYVHQILTIMSVVLCALSAALYVLRFAYYPRKCIKEWYNPVMSQHFSCLSICLILFGILSFADYPVTGLRLVWVGSVAQMFFITWKFSDLLFEKVSDNALIPSLLLPCVGCMIGGLGFAIYTWRYSLYEGPVNYLYLSRLWFGVGAFFGLLIFTITFRRALLDNHANSTHRHSLWVWLAALSIFGPSYLAVSGYDNTGLGVGRGVLYQSVWCISAFVFVVLGLGWFRGFFSHHASSSQSSSGLAVDLTGFFVPFSLSLFAFFTIEYYSFVRHKFFYVLCFITVAAASAASVTFFLHVLVSIRRGGFFTPRIKFSPLSFLKLSHEAFRFSLPKLMIFFAALEKAERDGGLSAAASGDKDDVISLNSTIKSETGQGAGVTRSINVHALEQFVDELECFIVSLKEIRRVEYQVLLPRVRLIHPGLNPLLDVEEAELTRLDDDLSEALRVYGAASGRRKTKDAVLHVQAASTLLKEVGRVLHRWKDLSLTCFRNHEQSTLAVAHKAFAPEMFPELVSEMLTTSPAVPITTHLPFGSSATAAAAGVQHSTSAMTVVLPFVTRQLPVLGWKTLFIRSLLHSVPARSQEIGSSLYRGLDSVTWVHVAQQVPGIIPRGAPGYKKYS